MARTTIQPAGADRRRSAFRRPQENATGPGSNQPVKPVALPPAWRHHASAAANPKRNRSGGGVSCACESQSRALPWPQRAHHESHALEGLGRLLPQQADSGGDATARGGISTGAGLALRITRLGVIHMTTATLTCSSSCRPATNPPSAARNGRIVACVDCGCRRTCWSRRDGKWTVSRNVEP
jgi:hypothetical protein